MSNLDLDVRAAKELGFPSYGYYIASKYDPSVPRPVQAKKKRKGPERKFSEEEAFRLWQSGMSDTQIAKALGVSHQSIHQWRNLLEIPTHYKNYVDTTKYRLAKTQDGTTIVIKTDEL